MEFKDIFLDIENFSIRAFMEVIALGEADPHPFMPLAYLYRDDVWERDESVQPKGQFLAWAVSPEVGDIDAEGFDSPRGLHELVYPVGCLNDSASLLGGRKEGGEVVKPESTRPFLLVTQQEYNSAGPEKRKHMRVYQMFLPPPSYSPSKPRLDD